jgi:signal transduction histidine kinase
MDDPGDHPPFAATASLAGPEAPAFAVLPASECLARHLPDGTFSHLAPTCPSLLGWAPDQLVGRSFFAFCHPDEAASVRAAWDGPASGGVNLRHRFRRSDGQHSWLQTSLYPAPEGREFVTLFRPAGELRVLEEQLRQAQKMAAIGWLAASVVHDFNNLLTIIKGYTEIMAAPAAGESELRRGVREIRQATDRAVVLVQQILSVVRKRTAATAALDLNAVVANLEPLLRRLVGDAIDVVTVFDDSAPRVRADPERVEQLLLNLAANARDAMPDGGQLRLETQDLGASGVASSPFVCLSVRDTGVGMDEATRARLFEPLFTTKEIGKGTGLGLTTVSGIVRQLSGQIEVETAPGRGATFRVYLPALTAEQEMPKVE